MSESNLYFVPKLTAEDLHPAEDLIPIAHPQGGTSDQCAITVEELGRAIGGEGVASGGVSQAAFDELKASVIADLNNLRDAIMFTQASLDNDAGVATDTFVAEGSPPPLVTE